MRRSLPFALLFCLAMAWGVAGAPAVCAAQSYDRDDAASRREIRDFQQFLSQHPWIANKLRQKPSLANDQGFLNGNPELPQFLNAHPFVQGAFRVDANAFMQKEQAFETSPPGEGGGRGGRRQEMRDFQQFQNDHPWIANKLKQNPSLANNKGFLEGNHELPDFLKTHPFVQEQLRNDPQGFMQRAKDFASREEKWGSHTADLAELNQFIANHPWIGKKLQENPQLATNGDFLNENRELKDFLAAYPYLQQQFKDDPQGLMGRARDYAEQNSM